MIRRVSRTRFSRLNRRSAVVVLELILSLPILFILLLAVAELGTAVANLQIVALASRDGGRIAAGSATLNAVTVASIRSTLDTRLQAAGFGASATQGVVLVETVGATSTITDGTCPSPGSTGMPTNAVRIRVCVPMTRLAPNLLKPFGFDISTLTAENETTFDYEM